MIFWIFELLILLIVFLDYRYYRTILTPIVILGTIYLAFSPIINLLSKFIDIFPITGLTMALTCSYLFVFFVPGIFYKYANMGKKPFEDHMFHSYKHKFEMYEDIIWMFFVFAVLCKVINLVQVIQIYGIGNTKRNEFGIFANIGYLAQILSPYIAYFGLKRKKLIYFFGLGIEFSVMILFELKGPIMITLIHMVLFYLILHQRITFKDGIKKGILLFSIGAILFISVYVFKPILSAESAEEQREAFMYAVNQFTHYFFSPFICSNTYFLTPNGNIYEVGSRVILAPFVNLYELFSGTRNFADNIIHFWPMMSSTRGANVGGIFSESVYQVGYVNAVIYIFVLSFIINYFYHRMCIKGRLVNVTAYLLTLWGLCFFGNYFASFNTFQWLIYTIIVDEVIEIVAYKKRVITFFKDKKIVLFKKAVQWRR